ncbi:secreted RxLR effector protein 161-like [Belonocnema kinseyi]|uniref:secreted RxLR effector protein 161-like n=1 Tax=Belonocnema kinseyi TaxID=2817044 RepID=UPI00143DE552|nr:secreted RxLR effector protein 161-like [Belonocnema kinseyi]
MENSKAQNTPMVTRQVSNRENRKRKQEKTGKKTEKVINAPYREATGSLLYLAGVTRPDIAYAVNYLAARQLNPTEDDWKDVKRIFRYIKGTLEVGITYKGGSDNLDTMLDESFRDLEGSNSIGGYLIRLYGQNHFP